MGTNDVLISFSDCLYLRGKKKIIGTGFCKHHMQLFSFLFNQEFGDLCKTVSNNLNLSPNHRCIVFCARPGGRHWGNLKSQKNSSSHQKTSTKSHGYIPSLSITPLRYINHLLYLLWRQLHALFFCLWGFFLPFWMYQCQYWQAVPLEIGCEHF